MTSLINWLRLRGPRADWSLSSFRRQNSVPTDPDEQLALLFKAARDEPEHLNSAEWAERAEAFQRKIGALASAPRSTSVDRSCVSRSWPGAGGPTLAALGIATIIGMAVIPTHDSPREVTRARAHSTQPPPEPRANGGPETIDSVTSLSSNMHAAVQAPDGPTAKRARPSAAHRSLKAKKPLPFSKSKPYEVHSASSFSGAPVSAEPARPQALGAKDTFAHNLRALTSAERALRHGNYERARSLLARRFSAELNPHATALRAVLACQTGNKSHGITLVRAQAKRHPNSPYLRRMRTACAVRD